MSVFNPFKNKKKLHEHNENYNGQIKQQKNESIIQLNRIDTTFYKRLCDRLKDYHIATINDLGDSGECICPKCNRDLIKVYNMIIIQNSKETLGINGYYCPYCKKIHISTVEIIEVRKRIQFVESTKFKAFVLSNSDHNIDNSIIEDALHMEAVMRNVLDKCKL